MYIAKLGSALPCPSLVQTSPQSSFFIMVQNYRQEKIFLAQDPGVKGRQFGPKVPFLEMALVGD